MHLSPQSNLPETLTSHIAYYQDKHGLLGLEMMPRGLLKVHVQI